MNSEDKTNHQSDWQTCVVCGNAIEPGCGASRINHHGNTINLCGPACLETFAQEPDAYIARLAKRMRQQALRESLAPERVEPDGDEGFEPSPSYQTMGAKRSQSALVTELRSAP